jgi:hypothetical protein
MATVADFQLVSEALRSSMTQWFCMACGNITLLLLGVACVAPEFPICLSSWDA